MGRGWDREEKGIGDDDSEILDFCTKTRPFPDQFGTKLRNPDHGPDYRTMVQAMGIN